MDPYPEHERLTKISDKSQVCGEFVDWLQSQGISLCRVGELDVYWPIHDSIQSLLAAFFDIDQKRLDAEKNAMLDAFRAANP